MWLYTCNLNGVSNCDLLYKIYMKYNSVNIFKKFCICSAKKSKKKQMQGQTSALDQLNSPHSVVTSEYPGTMD